MTKPHAVPAADLDLMRQYDTPTLCNVVELFDFYPRTAGYMDKRIQACFPKLPPMVGYASTATFRSAAASEIGQRLCGAWGTGGKLRRTAGPTRGRISRFGFSGRVSDVR